MTTTTNSRAEGKPGLDLSGYGPTETIGFTGIPAVHWVAAGLFVAGRARAWPGSARWRRRSASTGRRSSPRAPSRARAQSLTRSAGEENDSPARRLLRPCRQQCPGRRVAQDHHGAEDRAVTQAGIGRAVAFDGHRARRSQHHAQGGNR
jgi:hypothetical protein